MFALAALGAVLSLTVPATSSPRRVSTLAALGAIGALLVDIYLY